MADRASPISQITHVLAIGWSRSMALMLLPLALASCSLWDRGPAASEVVLVGDSIAQEASPYLRELLDGTKLVERYFGGTAPCDWLGKDLQAATGRVVVVSFTGNSLTPCMTDGPGGHLHGLAMVDKYRADLAALVGQIQTTGARVVLVGQPQRGPSASDGGRGDIEVAGINTIYSQLAEADGVSVVDAGAAVETADGTFASTLPCLPGEVPCGPTGRNAVRSEDGVHLCPVKASGACPVYSSGAFRYASAIAEAVKALADQASARG